MRVGEDQHQETLKVFQDKGEWGWGRPTIGHQM